MAGIVQKEKDGFIETIEQNGNKITVKISRPPRPKSQSRMASLLLLLLGVTAMTALAVFLLWI